MLRFWKLPGVCCIVNWINWLFLRIYNILWNFVCHEQRDWLSLQVIVTWTVTLIIVGHHNFILWTNSQFHLHFTCFLFCFVSTANTYSKALFCAGFFVFKPLLIYDAIKIINFTVPWSLQNLWREVQGSVLHASWSPIELIVDQLLCFITGNSYFDHQSTLIGVGETRP